MRGFGRVRRVNPSASFEYMARTRRRITGSGLSEELCAPPEAARPSAAATGTKLIKRLLKSTDIHLPSRNLHCTVIFGDPLRGASDNSNHTDEYSTAPSAAKHRRDTRGVCCRRHSLARY